MTEREREREREREKDRQTDRQRHTGRQRETDRERDRENEGDKRETAADGQRDLNQQENPPSNRFPRLLSQQPVLTVFVTAVGDDETRILAAAVAVVVEAAISSSGNIMS